MKKFMLCAMALLACGQMMAMENALVQLRNKIEKCAEESAQLSEDRAAIFWPTENKASAMWKKVYTAHVLSEMKAGKPVGALLDVKRVNINNQGGPVYDMFSHEYELLGVYERTGSQYCKSKIEEKNIEKDWQEICDAISRGKFTLTVPAPEPEKK